jgi:asparagine synthase (glutamine-hydrolysing)
VCGIVGLVRPTGQTVERDLIESMAHTLRHRGPDAAGAFVDGNVGLGHRRLSIIDTSAAANQPLFNEDRSVAVVFNGEIYNFEALSEELRRKGHRFSTRSDTEVIVHSWEEYGPDCVERFRGMFAIAVYDRNRHTLFLARDRLGKKPLYYVRAPNLFAFASEIKALRTLPEFSAEIDPQALGEFACYGNTLGPRSIYRHVRRLLPAHSMVLDTRNLEESEAIARYWTARPEPETARSEDSWLAELDKLLSESVRLRMISDVPLGAFLSGGVDSSLVVAYMVRNSEGPVRTFTMGFEEASHDESSYAEAVARELGTDHRTRIVKPDAVGVLDRLVETYDEPFADASAIPTYYLCQVAREHVTVALSGDGGDEGFYGYSRYPYSYWIDRAGRMLGSGGRRLLGTLASRVPRRSRLRRPLERMSLTGFDLYHHAMGYRPDHLEILHPDVRNQLEPARSGKMACDDRALGTNSLLDRYAFNDLHNYLPDDVLVKVDRASMAHSLEVRSPLLDHEIVGLAARIPTSLKLSGLSGKRVLRRLLRRFLPSNLVDRPKMAFNVPLATWFRRGGLLARLTDEMLADEKNTAWQYFDRSAVARRYGEHVSGPADLHIGLWRSLFFYRWCCRYLG